MVGSLGEKNTSEGGGEHPGEGIWPSSLRAEKAEGGKEKGRGRTDFSLPWVGLYCCLQEPRTSHATGSKHLDPGVESVVQASRVGWVESLAVVSPDVQPTLPRTLRPAWQGRAWF